MQAGGPPALDHVIACRQRVIGRCLIERSGYGREVLRTGPFLCLDIRELASTQRANPCALAASNSLSQTSFFVILDSPRR